DYMTTPVLTVTPEETGHKILSIMANNRISRVVVVRNQEPVGIIAGRDLGALFGQVLTPDLSAIFLARDIMKQDPITIGKDSDLAEAAYIMVRNRISGLPVVDSNNDLVGMVTKTDIARALAAGI
ncbi:MAG: CBS domain-containing protein, partial [Nitrososphaerales archaeon]